VAVSGAASDSVTNALGVVSDRSGDKDGSTHYDGSPSRSTLWFGFVLAFVSAWCAFILIGHFGFGIPRSLSLVDGNPERHPSDVISQPLLVSKPNVYKEVSFDPGLNPQLGEDFIFFIWFKARKPPVDGESLALMGKFDVSQQHRPGYALSLEGAPDGVRPKIYWNDAEGRGRWFALSSMRVRRKNWYLIAFVFSKDRFLSAHAAAAGDDSEPILLGGNQVEPVVVPQSNAAMVVGATGSGRFRGQLGPFGVLRGKKLAGRIKEVLASMAQDPNAIPSEVPSSSIALWASPHVDRGPRQIPIVTGAPQVSKARAVVESNTKKPSAFKVSRKVSKPVSCDKTKGKPS